MNYGFGQVEKALRTMHAGSETRPTQFASRLRNLARLGLPHVGAGSAGRRENYTVASVLHLAIAVDMMQLGCTPVRAVAVLRSYPDIAAAGILNAAQQIVADEGEVIQKKDQRDWFFMLDPAAMEGPQSPGVESQAAQTFEVKSTTQAIDILISMTGQSRGARRISFINVSAMLRELAQALGGEAFITEAADWAASSFEE